MRDKLFAVMQEVLAADNKALYPLDLITASCREAHRQHDIGIHEFDRAA